MENKKIGFTIGKFAPFHKGHQYLIETLEYLKKREVSGLPFRLCNLPAEMFNRAD